MDRRLRDKGRAWASREFLKAERTEWDIEESIYRAQQDGDDSKARQLERPLREIRSRIVALERLMYLGSTVDPNENPRHV